MIENKTKCFLFQNKSTFSALFRIKFKKKNDGQNFFYINLLSVFASDKAI